MSSSGNLPIITKGPQNLTVLITNEDPSQVQFRCKTAEKADHKWITVTQDKQSIGKTSINTSRSTYNIDIKLSNNGTQVYCEATNGSGTVRSEIVTLTILG